MTINSPILTARATADELSDALLEELESRIPAWDPADPVQRPVHVCSRLLRSSVVLDEDEILSETLQSVAVRLVDSCILGDHSGAAAVFEQPRVQEWTTDSGTWNCQMETTVAILT